MDVRTSRLAGRDWDGALGDGAVLQQCWAYGEAMAALGARVARIEVFDGSDRVGLAQVLSRRFLGVRISLVTRGPVIGTGADGRAITRVVADAFRPLVVTPVAGACVRIGLPVRRGLTLAHVDLTQEPDVLRAGMHAKWRNRLARAERGGVTVGLGRPGMSQLAALLDAEASQRREKGYAGYPPGFLHAWLEAAPGTALLAEARVGGERVAAMMFLLHGAWATYQLGLTTPPGRRAHAHNLILWRAMLALRDAGVRNLDLGLTVTGGLARFKVGTGATPVTLGASRLVFPLG
jgi:hypothetical protein